MDRVDNDCFQKGGGETTESHEEHFPKAKEPG